MHTGTIGLIHFIAALFGILLLTVSYRFIKLGNQDPVNRSFRYLILGMFPVTIYHFLEWLMNAGFIGIEINATILDYSEHMTFIFLGIMMAYGIKLVKTEIYDKFARFNKRTVKKRTERN